MERSKVARVPEAAICVWHFLSSETLSTTHGDPTLGCLACEVERLREPVYADPISHYARRMLQALDAYWLHCDGLPPNRHPRGKYETEDWWGRFEKYRALVEGPS